MSEPGVDDVVVPAQVLSLQKRIEMVSQSRARNLKLLADANAEARSLDELGTDARGAERARKRAARLRIDIAGVEGEIETLRSLVAARLARGARPFR